MHIGVCLIFGTHKYPQWGFDLGSLHTCNWVYFDQMATEKYA
jgi:hypothetical protein